MVESVSAILQTKIALPVTRAELVIRPRLAEQFNDGLARPLTLVCAPAGFGKTTLIREWRDSAYGMEASLAWLSLDEDDNDPTRFLTYLMTTLAAANEAVTDGLLEGMKSAQPPPPKVVLTALIERLERLPHAVVLALDDYHVITARPIHEMIAYLVDHLPSRMRLVLTSREDPPLPLARLRARNQLSEIRVDDLRFRPEESAMFLRQALGLELTSEQVAGLDARAEGWIAELQLAALAMKGRRDIASFVKAFTGSHRFILDYLSEEVLSRQPEILQTFLMETSILGRMCAPLCAALTGQNDSQATLEHLERVNLFMFPLDDESRWYRYHQLFAEVLRNRLQRTDPHRVLELHRQAADWYVSNELPGEAINHLLTIGDFARAVTVIERFAQPIIVSGQIQTVLDWLNSLPDALVRTNPHLLIIHALALMFGNQFEDAENRLQDAEHSIQPDTPPELARFIRGRTASVRGSLVRFFGDIEGCVAYSRRALDLLPTLEWTARIAMILNASLSFLLSGDVTAATEDASKALVTSAQNSGNRFASLATFNIAAQIQVMQGRLRQAAVTYQAAWDTFGQGQMQMLIGSAEANFGFGDIRRLWNDLDTAERHLRQGMEYVGGQLSVDAATVIKGYIALARLQQAQGESSSASATVAEYLQLAQQRRFVPALQARGEAAQAELWLRQDRLEEAVQWADRSGLHPGDAVSYWHEFEYLTLARVRIAQDYMDGSRRVSDGIMRLLGALLEDAESKARTSSVLEILILKSLALQALGSINQALAVLRRALSLAEAEGYVRIFVDEGARMQSLLRKVRETGHTEAYVMMLLDAFSSVAQPVKLSVDQRWIGSEIEPLSERELDVLRLLASGESTAAIASALFVSIGTVKKHINNIFVKLDVHSRTHALARAREYKLL